MWFPSQNLSKPSNSATCFNNLVRELCQPDTWALVALHLLSCPLKHKHLWKKYKTFYFSFWMLLPHLWQVGGLSLASGLQCFWVCSGTVGPTARAAQLPLSHLYLLSSPFPTTRELYILYFTLYFSLRKSLSFCPYSLHLYLYVDWKLSLSQYGQNMN